MTFYRLPRWNMFYCAKFHACGLDGVLVQESRRLKDLVAELGSLQDQFSKAGFLNRAAQYHSWHCRKGSGSEQKRRSLRELHV